MKARYVIAATLAVAALALTGCSSTSTPTAKPTVSTLTTETTVNVGLGTGTYGVAFSTPYFADNKLKVVQQPVTSGAAATPLVLNGQLQFAVADSIAALTAISQKLPLVIVGLAVSSGSSAKDDSTGVLVRKGGPITSAQDLNGKTVAVNALGNTAQVAAEAAIDKLGGDSKTVHFVELAPQAMGAAVGKGTVDAAMTSEPGIVQGKANGLASLFGMSEVLPSDPLFVYVTSQSYLDQHPDVVNAFVKSLAQANSYLDKNPDQLRSAAVTIFHLTPDQAQNMILPKFVPTSIDPSRVKKIMDLMIKYKVISSPVDLKKAIYVP